MWNATADQTVTASRMNHHFRKPLCETYNFAQIPGFIQRLLTGSGQSGMPGDVLAGLPDHYDKVVLLYLDAFGWAFFQRYADQYPFLQRFLQRGVASRITAQFPSTTAAHMTTIHLGLPVWESGIYEWFYYEPFLDRLIAPLLFSYAGDKENGTIRLPEGISAGSVFNWQTVYEQLAMLGVKSYVFQHVAYTRGGFADLALRGAELRGYKSLAEGLLNLGDAVVAEKAKAYFFYYYDLIDSVGHSYGPSSRQFAAEIDLVMTALERFLHATLEDKANRTLLLLTADHGQVDVSPETTIYLNHHIPELADLIRRDGAGRLLVPAGSARDLFLYIQPGRVEDAFALLHDHPSLRGKADLFRVSDLVAQGYFGAGTPSEMFQQRIADLVLLPKEHETVFWYEKGRFEMPLWGHHGGLHPDEVDIPLLALSYG